MTGRIDQVECVFCRPSPYSIAPLDLMEIPRSRSRSMVSRIALHVPLGPGLSFRSAVARVDIPWSICAIIKNAYVFFIFAHFLPSSLLKNIRKVIKNQ
jgi:hypothetical protein